MYTMPLYLRGECQQIHGGEYPLSGTGWSMVCWLAWLMRDT